VIVILIIYTGNAWYRTVSFNNIQIILMKVKIVCLHMIRYISDHMTIYYQGLQRTFTGPLFT